MQLSIPSYGNRLHRYTVLLVVYHELWFWVVGAWSSETPTTFKSSRRVASSDGNTRKEDEQRNGRNIYLVLNPLILQRVINHSVTAIETLHNEFKSRPRSSSLPPIPHRQSSKAALTKKPSS